MGKDVIGEIVKMKRQSSLDDEWYTGKYYWEENESYIWSIGAEFGDLVDVQKESFNFLIL